MEELMQVLELVQGNKSVAMTCCGMAEENKLIYTYEYSKGSMTAYDVIEKFILELLTKKVEEMK